MPVAVEQKRKSRKPPTKPLDSDEPASQMQPEPESIDPVSLSRHAFIVEDEIAHRDYLVRLLRQMNYETHSARDAAEAQENAAILPTPPLIIFVDMTLPDMESSELIPILRGWFREARIIAMMTLTGEEFIEAAFDSGCDAFLVKPGGFKELPRYLELLEKDPTALNQLVFDEHGAYFRE